MYIIAEFKRGASEGWNMFWSPLAGLVHTAAGIIGHSAQGQQARIAQ